MYKLLEWSMKILVVLSIPVVGYVFLAWVLSRIPINTDFKVLSEQMPGTDVYVRSNGVHTDIILPIQSMQRDWREKIAMQDLHNINGELSYISFGWGDRGFYLDTPTWADLKPSTAFIAAFGLGSTAMHVEAVEQPHSSESVRRIRVTDTQLAALVTHIDQSFVYNEQGQIQKIDTTANYNGHDAFYEAHGRYSILTTCNEWTRKGLSTAGIRTAIFSPQESGILRHLPQ